MNLNTFTTSELLTHAEQSDDPLVRALVDELLPFEHIDPDEAKHAADHAALVAECEDYDILTADDLRKTLDRADELRELAEGILEDLETLAGMNPNHRVAEMFDPLDRARVRRAAERLGELLNGTGEDEGK
jgi:hypothetical protein